MNVTKKLAPPDIFKTVIHAELDLNLYLSLETDVQVLLDFSKMVYFTDNPSCMLARQILLARHTLKRRFFWPRFISNFKYQKGNTTSHVSVLSEETVELGWDMPGYQMQYFGKTYWVSLHCSVDTHREVWN